MKQVNHNHNHTYIIISLYIITYSKGKIMKSCYESALQIERKHLIATLPYLACPMHRSELSLVCLSSSCNCIICGDCQIAAHLNHDVRSYGELVESLSNPKIHSQNQLLIQIQERKRNLITQLNQIQQRFNDELSALKTKIIMFYNQLQGKAMEIMGFYQRNSYLHRLHKYSSLSVGSLQHYITNTVIPLYSFSDVGGASIKSTPLECLNNASIIRTRNCLRGIEEMRLWEKLGGINQHWTTDVDFSPAIRFQWDTKHKANKIVLAGKVATQTAVSTNLERFVFMTPSISNKSHAVQWKVRINKLKSWIGVGICSKQSLISQSYKFQHTVLGHGSYLISHNGYAWNSHSSVFNAQPKGFQYAAGDIIVMNYNPITKIIKFSKGGNQFSMQISKLQGQIVPCANLCSIDDQVQIIQ